ERKFRIQVGSGVEGALTKAVTDRIVLRVRDRFRANEYAEGVTGAVDEIIENLGSGVVGGATAGGRRFGGRDPEGLARERQAAEQAAEQERREAEARQATATRLMLAGLVTAIALGVGLYVAYRRSRAAKWRDALPEEIREASEALAEGERKRAAAMT